MCHNRELSVCLAFTGHHLKGMARTATVAPDIREGVLKAGREGGSSTQTGRRQTNAWCRRDKEAEGAGSAD